MGSSEERSEAFGRIGDLFDAGTVAGLSDGQLLGRFVSGRERPSQADLAFEAILTRHGPMVVRVCRGILADRDAADDAAQATFVVLARRADSIRARDSLASWLHGVARRVALRARSDTARRRRKERIAAESSPNLAVAPIESVDRARLHTEVDRLPRSLREPIVLFHLEGMTYDEIASRLGVPEATVRGRLARARDRLRARFGSREIAPAALLGLWSEPIAVAVLKSALHPRPVPAAVARLAERTIWSMRMTSLETIGLSVVTFSLVIGLVVRSAPEPIRPTPAPSPRLEPPAMPIAPGEGGLIRTYSDGTVAELVGISTHPSGEATWWSPSGKRLALAPYHHPAVLTTDKTGAKTREFAMKLRGPSASDRSIRWRLDRSSYHVLGNSYPKDQDGADLPEIEMVVTHLPIDRPTTRIELGLGIGRWQEIFPDSEKGRKTWRDVKLVFGTIIPYNGRPWVAVGHNLDRSATAYRLMFEDKAGQLHPSTGATGYGFYSDLHLDEFSFSQRSMDNFAALRFQVRPYEYVDFGDVPLDSPR